ncbi:pseudouridine synthase [Bacillota bacterium LX-D]|nr:pseudouridine synthase [Bacillota bacterium LX-D]
MKERIQKVLARAGVASRRASEDLITQGKVFVNGEKITQLGYKVDPEEDEVVVEGQNIKINKNKIYILLNKPTGYVTTLKDPQGRKTVIDLLKDVPTRLFPVGRLDLNTEGLLILTNDGDFTYKLTHPKHQVKKTYIALVKGIPDQRGIRRLQKGIELEDGMTAPAIVRIIQKFKNSAKVEVVIHEGRNRQVRRMLAAIGHPVLSLKRTKIGNLNIGNLKTGEYRLLKPEEVRELLQS